MPRFRRDEAMTPSCLLGFGFVRCLGTRGFLWTRRAARGDLADASGFGAARRCDRGPCTRTPWFGAAKELCGRVDRRRLGLRLFGLHLFPGFDGLARPSLHQPTFRCLFDSCARRGRWALQRRTLEHTQATAPIALEADETFALARAQQVHQAAETVAPFVKSAGGTFRRSRPSSLSRPSRSENLLNVSQVHRPACVRRLLEDLADETNTLCTVASRCRRRLRACRSLTGIAVRCSAG